MQGSSETQSKAEFYINQTGGSNLDYPPLFDNIQLSPPPYPTVLDDHEFGGQMLETSLLNAGKFMDPDSPDGVFRNGSAPIAINTRKRTRTISSGVSSGSDTKDSFLNNSAMEQRYNLSRDEVFGSSPKQGRGTINPNASASGHLDYSCDGYASPDNYWSTSPICGSLPKTSVSQVSKPLEGKRADRPKENLNQEDREIIMNCLQTGIQLINDNGLKKTTGLSIEWMKPPARKVRPSYNCEGSRGAIKTEDGGPVELLVTLESSSSDTYSAVLIAACISDKKEQKVTGHPHFKTNCVSDEPSYETEIDGVSVICIKKSIQGKCFNLKLDVGIKRRGERTTKLDRKCRVVYRLCLLRQKVKTDGLVDWEPANWAQIVTDTISCEQSQGPPAISNMTSAEDNVTGGLVIAMKGKNFESKSEERSVIIKISSKKFDWSAEAKVFHNVTTPYSLAFKVPPFKDWREACKTEPESTSFSMQLEVYVDNRGCETPFEFTYTLNERQRREVPSSAFSVLPMEEVFSILDEVENPMSRSSKQKRDSHSMRVSANCPQNGFDQQSTLYIAKQLPTSAQRMPWKVEENFAASCTRANNEESFQWGWQKSREQSVDQDVKRLQIGDGTYMDSSWQS